MLKSSQSKILECVPNFSEGRDESIIFEIRQSIEKINGIKILHVDTGFDANRTVMTFAGNPLSTIEAAFQAVKKASELIDMTKHKGAHPRIGAADVVPLVPIKNMSMDEAVELSYKLATRIGNELNIPVYCYENSTLIPERRNLENIRKGGYESLQAKITENGWQPDFGPINLNYKSGATIVGARNILIAFNVNLNTTSPEIASEIASQIRESGKIITDKSGKQKRIYGSLKSVKAIGWYIKEYNKAQVSTNITNIDLTQLHEVFETIKKFALQFKVEVTGSELIGLIPLNALISTGLFYATETGIKKSLKDEELIQLATEKLGLSEIKIFEPKLRIIEYLL